LQRTQKNRHVTTQLNLALCAEKNKPMIEIIVILEIKDKIFFEEFERKAIDIMSNHDGKLISAFEPNETESTEKTVDEVHYLQFSDIQAFNNYRKDPKLLELSELRNKAILKTKIIVSEKFKNYA